MAWGTRSNLGSIAAFGTLDAGDCETKSSGKTKCRTADKKMKVTFSPSKKVAGQFKAKLQGLDFEKPQAGPLSLTITHGDVDRVGSNGNGFDLRSKLVCKN